jgi:hypothetical protein
MRDGQTLLSEVVQEWKTNHRQIPLRENPITCDTSDISNEATILSAT